MRSPFASSPTAAPATDSRTLRNTGSLLTALREIANEYSAAKVLYSEAEYRRFAEDLASIFQLAGWQVNFNRIPISSYNRGFTFDGVEVLGANAFVVNRVVDALRNAGIHDARRAISIEASKILPSNPKFNSVQGSVRITIGDR